MSTTRKVLKNSGIYGFVSILQKGIGFFMLSFYTHYLTTYDYGVTAVVGSVVSFFAVFYMLSLNASISRFYFDYKDNEEELKEFWGTNILFVMINSVALSALLIIFRKYLLMPLADGIDFYPYLFLALVSITLNPIYNIFQSTLQTQQNGRKYGINNMCYFLTNLTLTIIFVMVFKLGAVGILLSASVTDIIFFIYTLIDFVPKVKLTINKKYLKISLRYSLPLVPHSLAGWTMAMLDKLFLNGMKTKADVGIYNIGYQFGNIINILTTAVNQAFVPWFFEKMDQGEKGREEIVKFSEYAIVAYGFIAMMISLFGEDVLRIMVSRDFREGWKVVPFICFAYVFNGIYYFFCNTLFYNKNGTKYVPIGTFSSAIINAILNMLLIPKMGIVGAAIASLLAMFLSSVLVFALSAKIEKVPYKVTRIYGITFIFLFLSLFSFLNVYITNAFMFILIKILILLITLIALRLIYKNEIKVVINSVSKIIKAKIK